MRYTIKHNCIGTTTYEKAINKSQYDIKGCNLTKVFDKLGQLEDIEEELGIDLITLFKALKKGIYFKHYDEDIIHYSNDIEKISPTFEIKYELCCNFQCLIIISEEQKDDGGWLKIDYNIWHLKYSDYGKTWALTRRELEENEEKN